MSTYIAESGISLNIKLESGHYKHVCFELQTNGQSVFVTEDKSLIEAMDKSHRNGVLYKKEKENMAEKKDDGGEKSEIGEVEIKEVEVECLDDAKEYLVNEFGIPKTAVKKKADVLNAAKMNGVKFVGELS